MKKGGILLIIILFFNACDQTKSVEYYEQNPEIAKKRSLECRDRAIISQDCVNAHKVGFPKDENESW